MTVSPRDFELNPSTLDDRRKSLFAGTYKLNGGLLVMLDPARSIPCRYLNKVWCGGDMNTWIVVNASFLRDRERS